jgi:Flp pilus assembly protein TadG
MYRLIRRLRARRDSSERGQILLMTAGGIVAMLLISGLVIDTGIGFRERRDAQNLSDLAAMAGTKVVADFYIDDPTLTSSEVWNAIDDSLELNGCAGVGDCTWTAEYVKPIPDTTDEADLGPVTDSGPIPTGAQGTRVTTNKSSETFFMRLVGIDTVDVSAPGTALTSQLLDGAPEGVLLPMAIYDADYEPGTLYTLQDGMIGPGNFGWLSWDGSQAMSDLADWVCVPSNPEIPSWPTYFDGQVGAKTGQAPANMRDCLDDYIENGTTVLIPLWDQANGQGSNLEYNLVGLAAFRLTGYDQPVIKSVTGEFIDFFNLSPVPGGYGAAPCNLADPTCNAKTNFIGLTR